jgi:hypothetical protein
VASLLDGNEPAPGFVLPRARAETCAMAYRADAQGNAIRDQIMVSIDLSDICFA